MTQYCLSSLDALDPAISEARQILIACDFDGTLCPIANSPSEVRMAPYMLETLRSISSSARLKLAVISGRSLDDLTKRLPVDAVLAGNHGLEIRGAGLDFEHECARRLRPELERATQELALVLSPWRKAWIEDKRLSLTVHYRAVDPCQQNALRRAVRRCAVGRCPSIGLRAAKKALELYPKVGWSKGAALTYVKQNTGPFDLCFVIGDDYTDESMFHEGGDQIGVRVGPGLMTSARFYLNEPSDVAVFLQHIRDVSEIPAERWAGAGAIATLVAG